MEYTSLRGRIPAVARGAKSPRISQEAGPPLCFILLDFSSGLPF
jgi:hypothetical protein